MKQNKFEKYNYIINEKNGEIFPSTDFYFYPLSANQYAEFYKVFSNESYPLMAFIYLTNKCSDDCIGCFAKTIEDSDATLDRKVIQNLLQDLSENGTKSIKLAGREPTMSPYLSDCLELSKKLGLSSVVITSGANIDRHKESLATACTHLRVSLNVASEELHEKFHRPTKDALRFSERVDILKDILVKRNSFGLLSGATFLVRNTTINNAFEYAQLCKELGFNYVRYTVIDAHKGSWSKEWQALYYRLLTMETDCFKVIIHEDIPGKYFDPDLLSTPNSFFMDPAIISRVTIHANGKVNSCHEGWRANWPEKDMATYGNINEESFNEIWIGEKRRRFIEYINAIIRIKDKDTYRDAVICDQTCKYSTFNLIQRWIINQITNDSNVKISNILIEQCWES